MATMTLGQVTRWTPRPALLGLRRAWRRVQQRWCGITIGHVWVLRATVPVGRPADAPARRTKIAGLIEALTPMMEIAIACPFCGTERRVMGEWRPLEGW